MAEKDELTLEQLSVAIEVAVVGTTRLGCTSDVMHHDPLSTLLGCSAPGCA